MLISDIQRIAHAIIEQNQIENDFIEYKKSATFKDKILKTACAYANNYMNREIGLIFIGIEEVDNPETGAKALPLRPITGIDDALIETTETTKSIKLKAGRYIRIKRDSKLPNSREEFELLKKFANYNYSSNLNERATLDDLSYEYMKEYLIAINAKPDIRSLSKLDMAKRLGLINQSDFGGNRVKNFAVLMFAENPDKFIPNSHVEIIREAINTDKMESKVFDGPIWIQAKQISKYFKDNIMASYTIRDNHNAEHRIVYNWPFETFEELATNCLLHKEYESPNYIGIYVYNDKITFVNHNRPLPPVTIDSMNSDIQFDDRQYLNPEIKEMFFALDLIESYGSGIRRAKDALTANNSPALNFLPSNESDNYTMAIMQINAEFARIKEEELQKTLTTEVTREMTREMTREIKQLMKTHPQITAKELATHFNTTEETIRYKIKILKRNKEIERSSSTKSGYWTILK